MTFLIAASELDLNDPESREKLKPLHRVLDKGWMIPCHAPLCRLSAFFGACLLAFLLICLFVCLFVCLFFCLSFCSLFVPAVPAKMSFNMDASSRSYRNLTLSYRGSERQSPNCLQLALRFSRIMEAKAAEHPPGTSTVDRLNAVIAEFHNSPGLSAKHRLDEDKQRSVFNVLAGTCSDPLSEIRIGLF